MDRVLTQPGPTTDFSLHRQGIYFGLFSAKAEHAAALAEMQTALNG